MFCHSGRLTLEFGKEGVYTKLFGEFTFMSYQSTGTPKSSSQSLLRFSETFNE
jgi:hypothetical protein